MANERGPVTLGDMKVFFATQATHGGIDLASVNATLEILWQQLQEAQAYAAVDRRHRERAEQELAQVQKLNDRLLARDTEWAESNAKAVTLYAEARALLEEVGGWKLTVRVADADRYNDLVARVRAFLARKEQTNG